MTSNLAFRIARSRVNSFADESEIICQHHDAMVCRDCEDFLQLGIEAFEWLIRADEKIRFAVFSELIEHDPKIDAALRELFRNWLVPCDVADKWIRRQQAKGFELENLGRFRECESEVRSIVGHFEDEMLSPAMCHLCDQALDEHRNGQTAEFIPGE